MAIKIIKNGQFFYVPEAKEIAKKIDQTIDKKLEQKIPDKVLAKNGGVLVYQKKQNFPAQGKINILYKDQATNKLYQWNNVEYIELSTDSTASYDIIFGGTAENSKAN